MSNEKKTFVWILAGLICFAIWTIDVNVRVAQPIVIQAADVEGMNLDQVVRDNLPPINLPGRDASRGVGTKAVLTALVIGALLYFTRKRDGA